MFCTKNDSVSPYHNLRYLPTTFISEMIGRIYYHLYHNLQPSTLVWKLSTHTLLEVTNGVQIICISRNFKLRVACCKQKARIRSSVHDSTVQGKHWRKYCKHSNQTRSQKFTCLQCGCYQVSAPNQLVFI